MDRRIGPETKNAYGAGVLNVRRHEQLQCSLTCVTYECVYIFRNIQSVASLGFVSPGVVNDGCHPMFLEKI